MTPAEPAGIPAEPRAGRRQRFQGWLRSSYPDLTPAKDASPLPEAWRPSAEQITRAEGDREERLKRTRWTELDGHELKQVKELLAPPSEEWLNLANQVLELANLPSLGSNQLSGLSRLSSAMRTRSEKERWLKREILFSKDALVISVPTTVPEVPELLRLLWDRGPDAGHGGGPAVLTQLLGNSGPIHAWRQARKMVLASQDAGLDSDFNRGILGVEDYLRFFCHHLSGDRGYFLIVENDKEIAGSGPLDFTAANEPVLEVATSSAAAEAEFRDIIGPYLFPITPVKRDSPDNAQFTRLAASMIYGERLFHCGFSVSREGEVTMEEEHPVELPKYADTLPVAAVRSQSTAARFIKDGA